MVLTQSVEKNNIYIYIFTHTHTHTILRTILDSTYTTVNIKMVFFNITCICYNTFTILHPALKVTKIVYRNSCCIINLKSEYHTLITITFQLQKKLKQIK